MVTDFEHTPVSVEGKTTVVIGGTSGIGQAIALGFASEGADVVATSRSKDKVADTADMLRKIGVETIERTCDVKSRESVERLCEEVNNLGGIDILIHSQGAITRESIRSTDEEDWNHITGIMLDGVYRSTQVFAEVMKEGSIINISSLAAQLAIGNALAYSSAKGGVEAFTRATAKELAPDIRVNAISPGFVITPQNKDQYAPGTSKRQRIEERTPLGRVANREEIVGAAVYLGSDAASYTTGEVIRVDGGFANNVF